MNLPSGRFSRHGQACVLRLLFLAVLAAGAFAQAPVITTRSLGLAVAAGQSAVLTVSATGAAPLAYQWLRNGQVVAGATGATLNISSARMSDAGWYLVSVTNGQGAATSVYNVSVAPAMAAVASWGSYSIPTGMGSVLAVESGADHSLVLKADHTVMAWGRNQGGQCNVPAALSDVVAVSGGGVHSVALRSDGTVIAWGDSTYNQTAVPAGLNEVVAVSAGYEHTLALRANGTVVAWGRNDLGQSTVLEGVSDVVAVAGGYRHSLALKADGTVVVWLSGSAMFVPAGLTGVVAVSTGGTHNLALKNDGTVVAWGDNWSGQINVPAGLTGVIAVSAGGSRSVALKSDGTLAAWGDLPYSNFTVLSGFRDVAAVSARGGHVEALIPLIGVAIVDQPRGKSVAPGSNVAFAVAHIGTPPFTYQWKKNGVNLADGGNVTGATSETLTIGVAQLADAGVYTVVVSNAGPSVTSAAANLVVAVPPTVAGSPLARLAVPGSAVTIAVTATGGEPLNYIWQHNGQEIAGATAASLNLTNLGLADAGWYHATVSNAAGGVTTHRTILNVGSFPSGGTVAAWGDNSAGQVTVPAGLRDIAAIAAGASHTLALKSDGTIIGWGSNRSGEVTIPTGLSNVVAIAASNSRSLALRSDGTVIAWGEASWVPPFLSDVVAIAAGPSQYLAIRSDGTVVSWSTSSSGPGAIPAGLASMVAISAGNSHYLALRADGTVAAWGQNDFGECNVPLGLADAVAVAAGAQYSLALRRDGTVIAWGHTLADPSGVRAGLNDAVAISAGPSFALALKSTGRMVGWGDNSWGQVNVPADLGTVGAVSAGYGHALALVPEMAPVFTAHPAPASRAAAAGSTVTYTVTVTGSSPFSYQWKKDGIALPGATSSSFTLLQAQESDNGSYTVVVSNIRGEVTSDTSVLTVNGPPTPPVLRGQSTSLATMAGVPVSLGVTAAGSNPLSYQWYQGAAGDVSMPLAGATGAELALQASDRSLRYWVRTSNPAGTLDSAEMIVLPWVARTVASANTYLGGASFANGRYFVFGDGMSASSPNGIDWTTFRVVGANAAPGGRIVYGRGVYVAGGGSAQSLFTSFDGANWTSRRSAQNGVVSCVQFDGERFIAVGSDCSISTSTDGLAWTSAYSSSSYDLRDLAIGGGMKVAVGVGLPRRVMISANGTAWSSVPAPTNFALRLVVYGHGRFVALDGGGSPSYRWGVWTSEDGTTWVNRALPKLPDGTEIPLVAYAFSAFGGDMFVLALGRHILLSNDGITWAITPNFFDSQGKPYCSLAYGNGQFIASRADGTVLQSLPIAGMPAISSQTASHIVRPGLATTLTAVTSGAGLSYQWYRGTSGDTSLPIAGATGTSLAVSAVTADQSYWLRVANAVERVDGATIDITVATLPTIGVLMPEREVVAGQTISLESQIGGVPAPTLQWYAGTAGDTSHPIAGATSRTLSLTALSTVARYWVRATNMAGTTDSVAFRVTPWVAAYPLYGLSNVRKFGDVFVAVVGYDLKTSSDVRAWTTVVTLNNSNLKDVAQGAGLYVAVGERGFYSSPDLVNWTQRNQPASAASYNGALSIARGNNRFVAVGFGHYFSANGIDWSSASLPSEVQLESVVFDGTRFVGTGYIYGYNNANRDYVGVVYGSVDGESWTRLAENALPENAANANTALDHVAYFGGRYVATSRSASCILVSSDGSNWTRRNVSRSLGGRLRSIAYLAGRYVVGTEYREFFTSPDALNWTPALGPVGLSASTLLPVDGRLLAISATGTAYSTTDLVNWVQLSGVPTSLYSVAYGGGRFLGFGAEDYNGTYTSDDGLVWRLTTPDLSRQSSSRIVYGAGEFVVKTDQWGVLYRSADGEHWLTERKAGATSQYTRIVAAGSKVFVFSDFAFEDVAFGQGRYVGVGAGISVSSDGLTWTRLASVTENQLRAVAYGNGMFAAIGGVTGNGVILTSIDGLSWIPRTSPTTSYGLWDIVFSGDRFLAATSEGIMFSLDGVSWQMGEPSVSPAYLTAANGIVLGTGGAAWRRADDGLATTILGLTPVREIPSGGTTTLSVTAGGSALTYQWYRGLSGNVSDPLPGATAASFVTPPSSANQRYWVRVSGASGIADSATVQVNLAVPPVITEQPFSAEIVANTQSITLRVGVESGSAVSYQWYYGRTGSTIAPVIGGNGAELFVSSLNYTTRFWVRVTNGIGSTDSAEAVITPWTIGQFSNVSPSYATSGLAFGNGRFVVTGARIQGTLSGVVQTSTNGQNWSAIESPLLGPVAFGGAYFFAVSGTPNNQLFRSTDGATWTLVNIPGAAARFAEIFFVGGRFFAFGDNGTVATSTDGLSWSIMQVGTQRMLGAAFGGSRFVLVGKSGALFTSTSGTTWTAATSPTSADLITVAYGAGKFLTISSAVSAYTSTDGRDWSTGSIATSDGRLSLSHSQSLNIANGRFYGGVVTYTGGTTNTSADGYRWGEGLPGVARVVSGSGILVGANQTAVVTIKPDGISQSVTGGGEFFRAQSEGPSSAITSANSATAMVGTGFDFQVTASNSPSAFAASGLPPGLTLNTTTGFMSGTPSMAGSYAVILTAANAGGASAAVTLTITVLPQPVPTITSQAANQTVTPGSNAIFSVTASNPSAGPLTYRWYFTPVASSTPQALSDISGKLTGTGTVSLAIGNAQAADAGDYVCVVANGAGAVTSNAAQLTVAARIVRVVSQSALVGREVVVPVQLRAIGPENAVGFTILFDPAQLTFLGAAVGAQAADASLNCNVSQIASGKLGLALAKPTGARWAAGTPEIVTITFGVNASVAVGTVASLTFGDSPVMREISDATAQVLAGEFQDGSITVAAGFEADMNGNGGVSITDWVKVGRIVAGLDVVANGSDFQKADCAGRATLGNGVLSISDWVQAGRYAACLDPNTAVGGPTAPNP